MTRIKEKSIIAISEIDFFHSKKYENIEIWLGLATGSRNLQVSMCNLQFFNCFYNFFLLFSV